MSDGRQRQDVLVADWSGPQPRYPTSGADSARKRDVASGARVVAFQGSWPGRAPAIGIRRYRCPPSPPPASTTWPTAPASGDNPNSAAFQLFSTNSLEGFFLRAAAEHGKTCNGLHPPSAHGLGTAWASSHP